MSAILSRDEMAILTINRQSTFQYSAYLHLMLNFLSQWLRSLAGKLHASVRRGYRYGTSFIDTLISLSVQVVLITTTCGSSFFPASEKTRE